MASETTVDLVDTSILLVMSDEQLIEELSSVLKRHGATVHIAKNRFEAVGVYWKLFSENTIPRAIISKWWINGKDSDQFRFFSQINRLDDCTALPVLKNAVELDPDGLFIVYAKSISEAKKQIKTAGLSKNVYVCDRNKITAEKLASAVANNKIISRYRLERAQDSPFTSGVIDVSEQLEFISEQHTERVYKLA